MLQHTSPDAIPAVYPKRVKAAKRTFYNLEENNEVDSNDQERLTDRQTPSTNYHDFHKSETSCEKMLGSVDRLRYSTISYQDTPVGNSLAKSPQLFGQPTFHTPLRAILFAHQIPRPSQLATFHMGLRHLLLPILPIPVTYQPHWGKINRAVRGPQSKITIQNKRLRMWIRPQHTTSIFQRACRVCNTQASQPV